EQGLANTEFREGDIQDLPLFDNSVDVVISNCVMNLATDRHKAFSEAFRVLRPGGRLVVSDLAVENGAAKQALSDRDDFSAAYAAALDCKGYLAAISAAGFEDVQVLAMQKYKAGQDGGDPVTSGIQDVLA